MHNLDKKAINKLITHCMDHSDYLEKCNKFVFTNSTRDMIIMSEARTKAEKSFDKVINDLSTKNTLETLLALKFAIEDALEEFTAIANEELDELSDE
jgi:spore cortex formation protein SpoVR/YcgB (stage V sporulation)